jgi:hypothetical protein
MKAIVYESNSGYTRKYAELLANKAGLPAYEKREAGKHLKKGDEIIYMGWMLAGAVKGYKSAGKRYSVKALCGVGMGRLTPKVVQEITEKYHISDIKLFYLQGGFDMNKLHGIYKFMMKTMSKSVGESIEKKETKTEEELEMLDMMQNSRDCVKEENLKPILEWLGKI